MPAVDHTLTQTERKYTSVLTSGAFLMSIIKKCPSLFLCHSLDNHSSLAMPLLHCLYCNAVCVGERESSGAAAMR